MTGTAGTNEQRGIKQKRIISGTEYVKVTDVREGVRRSDNIRLRTLDKCYSIPGYADLPRKVQNAVYDNVKTITTKGERKCVTEATRHRQTPTASEA